MDLSKCGNGVIDPGESCDDGVPPSKKIGPSAIDDGCSALCQIEADWSCTGTPSVCTYLGVCGNGVLTSNKQCDDGNTVSGDGCSSTCQLEPGWTCRVPVSPAHQLVGTESSSLARSATTATPSAAMAVRQPARSNPAGAAPGRPACARRPYAVTVSLKRARPAIAVPVRPVGPLGARVQTVCSTATAPAAQSRVRRSRFAEELTEPVPRTPARPLAATAISRLESNATTETPSAAMAVRQPAKSKPGIPVPPRPIPIACRARRASIPATAWSYRSNSGTS